MKSKCTIVLIIACSLSISKVNAQMVLDNTQTVEYYVNNYLLGGGVIASNITFNGVPANQVRMQVGSFLDNGLGIGADSGMVMATENITFLDPDFPGFGVDENNVDDPDLLLLGNPSCSNYNNQAIIEFDFVVFGDSVSFNYVFGSQEYGSFTCTQFNDVFGFFLSGPGITGPYSNDAVNIARIPGTETPVGINTVNSGIADGDEADCEAANPNWLDDIIYFNENESTFPPPYNINISGFTTLLLAGYPVTCGSEYHIKLAIGDACDQGVNSAVFIEAGSFSSNGVAFVDATPIYNGVQIPNIDGAVENCTGIEFIFSRPDVADTLTVFYEIGGNATNGVDYEDANTGLPISSSVFFEAGEDEVSLNVTALFDGIDEFNNDSIVLTITNFVECGGDIVDTIISIAIIKILDDYLIPFTLSIPDVCLLDTVNIFSQAQYGVNPFTYILNDGGGNFIDSNNTGFFTVPFLDNIPEQYTIVITDVCNLEPFSDTTFTINIDIPELPIASPGEPDVVVCSNDPGSLCVSVSDGTPPYEFYWSTGNVTNSVDGNSCLTGITTPQDTTYFVYGIDACGFPIDTVIVSLLFEPAPPPTVNLGPDIVFDCETSATINTIAVVTGGDQPGDTYVWSLNGVYDGFTATGINQFDFIENGTISVAYDPICPSDPMVYDTISITFPTFDPFFATSSEVAELRCPEDPATLTVTASGGAGGYVYEWSNGDSTNSTNVNPPLLGQNAYLVTITDACDVEITLPVVVNVAIYPDITAVPKFIPSCKPGIGAFTADSVSGGAGDNRFYWLGAGAISNNDLNGQASVTNGSADSTYTLIIKDYCNNTKEFYIESAPFASATSIPNVITPNNDKFNDEFIIGAKEYDDFLAYFPETSVKIFNRWGNMVYESEQYKNDWRGGDLKEGVYYYEIMVDKGECVFKGTLHILQ
jgi:gliding motility-associated-like protein